MAVNNRRQYFHDVISELVGIKTGLGLTLDRTTTLLANHKPPWWDGSRDIWIRVHPEELDELLVHLLARVGAIGEPLSADGMLMAFAREQQFSLPEEWLRQIPAGPFTLPEHAEKVMYLKWLVIAVLDGREKIPSELASNAFNSCIEQYCLRSVMHGIPFHREWDGVVSLDQLFQSEEGPRNPETFFDQRFIDYLVAQPDDLSVIHWRQFEFLTAEYFKRVGYEVTVGPGRGDGGKDVVAIRKGDTVGPEMVMVQCKRYGSAQVAIDEVRAFYQTMTDEKATRGVFATTSRFASGAKAFCDARKYQLTAADGAQVRKWLASMKTVQTEGGERIV